MGISLEYFHADTSSADLNGSGGRVVIGGRASGLSDGQSATQATALYAVQKALAADGYFLSPSGGAIYAPDDRLRLTRQLMTGINGDMIDFQLVFESPTYGGVSEAIIYEIDSDEQEVESDYFPGTMLPIIVGWKGRATDGAAAQNKASQPIPLDTVPMPYTRTVTRINATIVRAGLLDQATSMKNASVNNLVNDAPWFGRPRGCWKMSRYKSLANTTNGYYTIQASAWTKAGDRAPYEDHRRIGVLRSRETGKIALPDIEKVVSAIQAPYMFGTIGDFNAFRITHPDAFNEDGSIVVSKEPDIEAAYAKSIYDSLTDGFVVVGPYRTVDFTKLWSLIGQL